MSVYKDEKTNTWKVYYRYTDWQGKVHQTTKRGFQTKREALAWEREQLNKVETDLDMSFESFIDIYTADMKNRIKENTWHTKEHIMRTKILPYFGQRKISDIQPKDIIAWQNEMIKATDKQGKPYSPVYLNSSGDHAPQHSASRTEQKCGQYICPASLHRAVHSKRDQKQQTKIQNPDRQPPCKFTEFCHLPCRKAAYKCGNNINNDNPSRYFPLIQVQFIEQQSQ